jgi:hypothetical protein
MVRIHALRLLHMHSATEIIFKLRASIALLFAWHALVLLFIDIIACLVSLAMRMMVAHVEIDRVS